MGVSAGDEVAVWAENDPRLVAEFAANLGIMGTQLDTRFMLEPVQVIPSV
jgi:sulfite reductase alpha subunit-like flavoprotein